MFNSYRYLAWLVAFWMLSSVVQGQATKRGTGKQAKRDKPTFRWVNELRNAPTGVQHGTFVSLTMKRRVGYCIFLPEAYERHPAWRFPVVYYLHGGRPGSETKSVKLAKFIHNYQQQDDVAPVIYVFVNGGPVSHYNLPDRDQAMGEDVFIRELIPHIDKTYRTIARREARGIEGFSQGGRGTTRIMFRHPQLFASAAPGGAGYATEKRISEEGGRESESLKFTEGDNTWDLARAYAKQRAPSLQIMLHVGTEGFNYQNNLEYMKFLDSLEIPYQCLTVAGVPHSAQKIYEKRGIELVKFHAGNLARASESER